MPAASVAPTPVWLNASAVSCSKPLTPPNRVTMSARTTRGARVIERDAERVAQVHQDLPVVPGVARRRNGARGSLQPSLFVRVGRLLLDVRRTWKHKIRGARQVGRHDALDDEKGKRAGRAQVDDPGGVADRSGGAGVEHIKRRHESGFGSRPERGHIRAPSAGCRLRQERARTFARRSRWEHRQKAP